MDNSKGSPFPLCVPTVSAHKKEITYYYIGGLCEGAFRVTDGFLQVFTLKSLKWDTERFLDVSDFIEAYRKNFVLDVLKQGSKRTLFRVLY
jgi:hypothetical protein